MSTITAILDPDADGSLHLPLPAELRDGKVMVVATLSAVSERNSPKQAMHGLRRIAERGGLESIANPLQWERDLRGDRPLPGRGE